MSLLATLIDRRPILRSTGVKRTAPREKDAGNSQIEGEGTRGLGRTESWLTASERRGGLFWKRLLERGTNGRQQIPFAIRLADEALNGMAVVRRRVGITTRKEDANAWVDPPQFDKRIQAG